MTNYECSTCGSKGLRIIGLPGIPSKGWLLTCLNGHRLIPTPATAYILNPTLPSPRTVNTCPDQEEQHQEATEANTKPNAADWQGLSLKDLASVAAAAIQSFQTILGTLATTTTTAPATRDQNTNTATAQQAPETPTTLDNTPTPPPAPTQPTGGDLEDLLLHPYEHGITLTTLDYRTALLAIARLHQQDRSIFKDANICAEDGDTYPCDTITTIQHILNPNQTAKDTPNEQQS